MYSSLFSERSPLFFAVIRAARFSLGVLGVCLLVSACASQKRVYKMKHDAYPTKAVSVDHIPDAVPRVEPRTIAGNKNPYKVAGKTYRILNNPEGYKKKGVASWYGRKFHGERTSNGEIYDMYAMTAAHTTLPIPSYVRVTNLDNDRSVIVRINDRGPFHDNRLIDLSYSAAKKLGYVNHGTARVMVEYIDPHDYRATATESSRQTSVSDEPLAPSPAHAGGYSLPANTFLQVGAFGQRTSAEALQRRLSALTSFPVNVLSPKQVGKGKWYRVHIGPISDNLDVLLLRETLAAENLPEPHVVYL